MIRSGEYKVVAVSQNSNSFGLRQMVVVNHVGDAYKMCANSLNIKAEGQSVVADERYGFQGCELVEKVADAPRELVRKLFKN